MIDPEKIFGVFEDSAASQEKAAFMRFQDTQVFKLGMFKKIIWNQKTIEDKMDKFLEIIPNLAKNIEFDGDAGEFVTHTRAWAHLKDFDPSLPQAQDAANVFSDEYTTTACDLAMSFWEEREEYEKCAHIKKVKDLLTQA
mgnify:CR=1 FL=1